MLARSRFTGVSSILGRVQNGKILKSSVSVKNARFLSTELEPREKMVYDVVTVGAGPAGLSAAIRLKQLAQKNGTDISVCVIDKGAEVGAHILSGNVFETRALDELFPNWKELDAPIETAATEDHFMLLTKENHIEIPHALLPHQLDNHGNYIISLSKFTRWLAEKAEELGVEIYAGFSADEVLYREDGSVGGVRKHMFMKPAHFTTNEYSVHFGQCPSRFYCTALCYLPIVIDAIQQFSP